MSDLDPRSGLFAALLKHWRAQRGMSQLDLAYAAGVSARHLSFLETGRSTPTEEMVLRLGKTLGVPLRHIDTMLQAAGHERRYDAAAGDIPPAVHRALDLLKAHHEPYPLLVVDGAYQVLDANLGARRLLTMLVPHGPIQAINLARLTFDPAGARPFLVNFDEVARALLWRLQREVLADPGHEERRALLEDLLAQPTVAAAWRTVDLSIPSEPAVIVHLRAAGVDLRFLTLVTALQAPQNAALEEMRIESWFPADDATARAFGGSPTAGAPGPR